MRLIDKTLALAQDLSFFFFSLAQSYKQIYPKQVNTQQISIDYILFRTLLLQYPKLLLSGKSF